MERREFLATVVALAATHTSMFGELEKSLPSTPPDAILGAFNGTLEWLSNNGWLRMLADVAGVPEIAAIQSAGGYGPALIQGFTPAQLSLIKGRAGFSDFGGNALLVPGKPAMSLLYFALSSPRVLLPGEGRPDQAKYPGLGQIEAVENYVYSLAPAIALDLKRHVLAVFAYEFRLKEKTPHNAHADMVYSRTGISRVGSDAEVWDPVERRYTNAVANPGTQQQSAVVPARYGLFLAEAVTHEDNAAEFGRIGCPPKEREAVFLLPVRKIIDGDALLGGASLSFAETHRDEKLARLFDALHRRDRNMRMAAPFELTRAPFYRQNASTTRGGRLKQHNLAENEELVNLAQAGSSVLLVPRPGPLVRPALQDLASGWERARFVVPLGIEGDYGNRFYSTLYLADKPRREELDEVLSASAFQHRGIHRTSFKAPKNGPEFVNIRHQYIAKDKIIHLGPGVPDWEHTVGSGGYEAALFLDSLCDGCVQADLLHVQPSTDVHSWEVLSEHILPAFSIVSAPDFFSQVDPIDLDVAELDLGYVEGGTEVVSGARVRANPFHRLPGGSDDAFPFTPLRGSIPSEPKHIEFDSSLTVTAVISASAVGATQLDFCRKDQRTSHKAPSTNTLPDASSNVFAPGWDITYSNVREPAGVLADGDKKQDFYFASFGLGSPFPEDMKLCAAANGMWASLSPDAARTFYGKLEPIRLSKKRKDKGRNSTVLPLLDTEIGQHAKSPAVHETRGWDGEQGPFLAVSTTPPHKLQVNYTDISRSDYVVNAYNTKMNMQSLQKLSVEESRQRMSSMVQALRSLPEPYQPRRSKLWLISAEAVEDWSRGAEGIGIPIDLAGTHNRDWATICKDTSGKGRGYLYIFGRLASPPPTKDDPSPTNEDPDDHVRLIDDLDRVYVCQAVRDADLRDLKTQDLHAWIIYWTMLDAAGTLPQPWARSERA